MKCGLVLVDYGSSEDEDEASSTPRQSSSQTNARKKYVFNSRRFGNALILSWNRKLPKLSENIVKAPPLDDPTQHQGRVHSSPHVEGQFAAYVYIPLALDSNEDLYKLLLSVIRTAKESVPSLQSDWLTPKESTPTGDRSIKSKELHISLSRPLYLRHHQREDLRRAVKKAAEFQSQ